MRNELRATVTTAAMVAPELLIMRTMGWTSLAEVALAVPWAALSSLLLVLISGRHRRQEFPTAPLVVALLGWVAWGATFLATDWTTRVVVAIILILPGLVFLLLEALGVTPVSNTSDPLP